MSTSEATYYSPPVPGGGTLTPGDDACCARAEPGVFNLPYRCTLPPGHDGQHEAGTTLGLMVASWTEEP